MSSKNRRSSTTASVGSEASFQTDEDGSEMGHLSVSVSELNQLRQHVRAMRNNMTGKNRNLAPAGDNHSVLEEVDLAHGGGSVCGGSTAAGLVVSDDALSPAEKRRLFRLSIVANILFLLGAILYICVAHGDLQWAQEIQGIPTNVLQADDDATWRDWQQQQGDSSNRRLLKEHVRARALQMQQDEDQDFNDMLWRDLPPQIQLALMVLGHNARTWNGAMTSSIEEQPWNKLTAEQRDAAKTIGYSAEEWDAAEEEEEEMWEASQAWAATTDRPEDDRYQDDRYEEDEDEDDRYEDGDDRYEDEDDRYEETDVPTDDETDAPTDDRYEDDRYEDEAEDDQYEDQDEDDRYQDDRYEDEDDDLPDDDQAPTAEEVFDWYKESAGDDNYPEDVGTGGITYTQPPKTAVPVTDPPTTAPPTPAPPTAPLKYTLDGAVIPSSDNPPPANTPKQQITTPAPQIPENVKSPADLMIWGEYDWEALPAAVQKAFEILGYNEELWNTGGVAFTEDLYWSDLTPAQQQQAVVLGYNQALWDEAEDGNYDIVSGEQGEDDEYYDEDDDAEEDMDDDYDYEEDRVGDDDEDTDATILFFAALCFMIAGVVNWIRERQVFHMWMVQGGVFGILSALTMSFSGFASLLLQTVSVHCFILQAFFMLRLRKTIRPVEGLETYSYALWGADILYAVGAAIQVVLVYWLHGDEDAYYGVGLAYGETFAAWCWFFTAIIYTMNTMALANKRIEEDSTTRTLTIQRQHPNGEAYTIRPAAIQLRNQLAQQPPCHDVVLT